MHWTKWLILLFLIITTGCTQEPDDYYPSTRSQSTELVKQLGQAFTQETLLFNQAANNYQRDAISLSQLQEQLANTRLAFKHVEFIVEYYYPEHVKAYINGAPLPHLDPFPYKELPLPDNYYSDPLAINLAPLDYQEPNAQVKPREAVAPEGLQTLDELLFSEIAESQRELIRTLTDKLLTRSRIMQQALIKRKFIEDYQLFEAARLELIRIFTLGVSGFDTPGSDNALPETIAAMESMLQVLTPLLQQLPNTQESSLTALFADAINKLANSEFDSFNRLNFLTENINPLYAKLLDAHLQLNPISSAALSPEQPSWNPYSKNLFAEDIINPYFYTILTQAKDNKNIQSLGKMLFHDKKLSSDNSLSCASCHIPEKAFIDAQKTASTKIEGASVRRNTPTIINAVYADRFFYDMRTFSMEEQITHVVGNATEFNTTLEQMAERVNADPEYRLAFNRAFPTENQTINHHQILSALTSYMISLRSFGSPFDRYVRGEKTSLAPDVEKGFNLFMGKAACGTCHYPPTFSGLIPPLYRENESEVLGVLQHPDQLQIDGDPGRSSNHVLQENLDIFRHAFKTTSVRNIELTAPYFHNGAYTSLEQVIEFYDQGGAQGLGLDYELPNQTLPSAPLGLSDDEKKALIAFLKSLTNQSLTH